MIRRRSAGRHYAPASSTHGKRSQETESASCLGFATFYHGSARSEGAETQLAVTWRNSLHVGTCRKRQEAVRSLSRALTETLGVLRWALRSNLQAGLDRPESSLTTLFMFSHPRMISPVRGSAAALSVVLRYGTMNALRRWLFHRYPDASFTYGSVTTPAWKVLGRESPMSTIRLR